MKVRDVMSTEVATCLTTATLLDAAKIMWDRDCGIVPVVDPIVGRLAGVITDRDACMAGLTQNRPFSEIKVASCMSERVHHCRPDQDVSLVQALMSKHAIRRLPVVEPDGKLVGLVSLNDLALAAGRSKNALARALGQGVLETMSAVCAHRLPSGAAASA